MEAELDTFVCIEDIINNRNCAWVLFMPFSALRKQDALRNEFILASQWKCCQFLCQLLKLSDYTCTQDSYLTTKQVSRRYLGAYSLYVNLRAALEAFNYLKCGSRWNGKSETWMFTPLFNRGAFSKVWMNWVKGRLFRTQKHLTTITTFLNRIGTTSVYLVAGFAADTWNTFALMNPHAIPHRPKTYHVISSPHCCMREIPVSFRIL